MRWQLLQPAMHDPAAALSICTSISNRQMPRKLRCAGRHSLLLLKFWAAHVAHFKLLFVADLAVSVKHCISINVLTSSLCKERTPAAQRQMTLHASTRVDGLHLLHAGATSPSRSQTLGLRGLLSAFTTSWYCPIEQVIEQAIEQAISIAPCFVS
jgi:hypothetical protein